jgi:integrase/recombinase XerD
MTDICWKLYPLLAPGSQARAWLSAQANLGLATNTIDAYGRGLSDFFSFCARSSLCPESATRADVSAYVRDLAQRPNPRGTNVYAIDSGAGLSNATLRQRLTAVRLFFDYLIEEGLRQDNPVGRGRYTPGKAYGGHRDRGLIPRYRKLPWIPSEEQWIAILDAARQETPRNRVMFAMSYDAALRREELCALEVDDIDPAHRLIRIRAEITKGRQERVVPYSEATGSIFSAYLKARSMISRARGLLFLSESRRNCAQPLSIWTWSKVVKGIANRSGVSRLTTHSMRHLCLTDLARAGWDIHEIARFAGHKSTETTLDYIHLSGRDLAEKFARGMQSIHDSRVRTMKEMFQ